MGYFMILKACAVVSSQAAIVVTVQVVETAITPPLALSERGRGAEMEPRHHGAPRHTP